MNTYSSNLITTAQAVLRNNDLGDYTSTDAQRPYLQRGLDSAVIALGFSHFDMPRAHSEIRSLLRSQRKDGLLPHSLQHPDLSDLPPDSGEPQAGGPVASSAIAASSITQPPLITTIVRKLHDRRPNLDFIQEVFSGLFDYHRWLHATRDSNATGLVSILHPSEHSADDALGWLSDREPASFADPQDLFGLPDSQPNAILEHAPFLLQDVLFNTILYRADEDLRALALELGKPIDEIDLWLKGTRDVFELRFWDAYQGLYFDFDLQRNEMVAVNRAAAFLPLYAGLASPEKAFRLVHEHWRDPSQYAPDADMRYRLTSLSRSEPFWDPEKRLCGAISLMLNWYLYHGLLRYDFRKLAEDLRQDSLTLVSSAGYREFYDPRNGAGYGADDFSITAALTIDWLSTK